MPGTHYEHRSYHIVYFKGETKCWSVSSAVTVPALLEELQEEKILDEDEKGDILSGKDDTTLFPRLKRWIQDNPNKIGLVERKYLISLAYKKTYRFGFTTVVDPEKQSITCNGQTYHITNAIVLRPKNDG